MRGHPHMVGTRSDREHAAGLQGREHAVTLIDLVCDESAHLEHDGLTWMGLWAWFRRVVEAEGTPVWAENWLGWVADRYGYAAEGSG
jgi:hypothetical protein